jgi:subtilisin family serine protease
MTYRRFATRLCRHLPISLAVLAILGACRGGDPSTSPPGELRIIITLTDRVDLTSFVIQDKQSRRSRIAKALTEKANATQPPFRALLQQKGGREMVFLPIINGIAVTVRSELIPELLQLPGVESIALDSQQTAPPVTSGVPDVPGWNLAAIHAPELWKLGFKGAGVVVANLDTGVDLAHADLTARWRGGADSWFDPFRRSTAPYDPIGHGTQTMGIIVGGDASGAPIGVAPEAQWIAAKIYDDKGNTTASVIHQAFQWLLDPDGNPDTPDAPDVVNASWGIGNANGCDLTFQRDLEALKAAEILVVFAAGNSGPQPLSSMSPANSAFSAGAIGSASEIASASSRGPSACTGGLFPDLVAPGVNVQTADVSLAGVPQYQFFSGTSYAAPHLAGAAALLYAAAPGLTVGALEEALRASAKDVGPPGPDDASGYGLVDVCAAYAAVKGLQGCNGH